MTDKERTSLIEHVLKYMFIDIPAQVTTVADAILVFYCVNYQGKLYQIPHRMFCSTVGEKAEKLGDLIISESGK